MPPTPPAHLRTMRRGGVYIAVLGAAMLVSLIGMSALAMVRAQRLTAATAADSDAARLYAESAVELGLQLIASDTEWRKSRASGAWIASQAIEGGTLTVEGIDPVDGDLANRPTDPLVLRGTGRRGSAVQVVEVTLGASGVPIDALSMALHTAGQLRVDSGRSLLVSGAPASTNGSLRNDGTITGDVECLAATSTGTITGSLTVLAPNKAMPDSGVLTMYKNLGTVIPSASTLEKFVLGPGNNPWSPGATNADGVYVLNIASNITIRRARIHGTLVISGAGRTVTIEDVIFMHPARADYPVLITDADVVLKFTGGSGTLSESGQGVNFNPPGAPYLGESDSDTADTYPSEIRGLIHVRGTVKFELPARVAGAIICESSDGSDAVRVGDHAAIVYDNQLTAAPPMGYTKSVSMAVQPGTWKRAVVP